MSDYKVANGCGDYPTNEISSQTSRRRESIYTKEYVKELRAKGYHQDSTGCWFHPSNPSVFGEDV